MRNFARVGLNALFRVCLVATLYYHLALPLLATTEGVSELEAYKQRLKSLEGNSDPARAAQMKQMQRLLSLMQRSLIIDESKAEPKQETPPPKPPPATKDVEPEPELPIEAQEEPPTPLEETATTPPTDVPLTVPAVTAPSHQPTKQAAVPTTPLTSNIPPTPEPPEIPAWFFKAHLEAAIGYQDNVLRSAFSNLDSTFLRGEAEFQLLNMRRESQRVMVLGQYVRTHFLEESSLRDEDLLFLLGQLDQRMAEDWWIGLQTNFFSAHQPFDDPDLIDTDSGSAPLKFTQLSIAPQLTWEPTKAHAWTARFDYRHETTDGLEIEDQDNDQWGAGLNYTFTPNDEHRFRFDYQYTQTDYESRRSRESTGEFITDTLDTTRHEWSASYRRTWEQTSTRWRAETRLRWILEDDDQGGYDDLARLELRGRLSWRYRKRTEIQAALRYGQYFYDSRQVSPEDTSLRERTYWAGTLSFEHAFNEQASFQLHYDFRENSGNRRVDRYSTQTLYSGFRFTF